MKNVFLHAVVGLVSFLLTVVGLHVQKNGRTQLSPLLCFNDLPVMPHNTIVTLVHQLEGPHKQFFSYAVMGLMSFLLMVTEQWRDYMIGRIVGHN